MKAAIIRLERKDIQPYYPIVEHIVMAVCVGKDEDEVLSNVKTSIEEWMENYGLNPEEEITSWKVDEK